MRAKTGTAGKTAAPPDSEGGFLVSQAHRIASRVFARMLKANGIDELSPAQGRIVFALWQSDGITQTELAARTKLDKSGLALTLDRLVESAQVERRKDGSDGRVTRVFLTDRNKAMHAAYRKASEEMIAVYYGGLARGRIREFERTLREIIDNLETDERMNGR